MKFSGVAVYIIREKMLFSYNDLLGCFHTFIQCQCSISVVSLLKVPEAYPLLYKGLLDEVLCLQYFRGLPSLSLYSMHNSVFS